MRNLPSGWTGCLWALLLLVFGCQGPSKDYYAALMEHGCQEREPTLTKECRQALLEVGNIDVASFEEHQDVLDKLLDALHILMHAPLSFPTDQKMFGLATLKEAHMYDFIDTFAGENNLNQAMLNYVMNAAPKITYGCNFGTEAYYTPWGIHVCLGLGISKHQNISGTFVHQNNSALLVHEARHQTRQHNVLCDSSTAPECDKGMDGPHGWQVAFLWGLTGK